MPKNSIALIGFMATGKTRIGKRLVKYLGMGYKFVDTDQEIVDKIGKSISNIFAEEGEAIFRKYEFSVCEKVSKLNKVVISCGGGIVLDERNVENLKKNCHIVLLDASLEDLYKRILRNGKETRPVIDKGNLKSEIQKVLNIRRPYYLAAADYVINTSNRKIKTIVREIAIKTQIKT